MIIYKTATAEDYEAIAQLHTQNWKESYRGMLSDDYLDNQIDQERLATWKNRLENPAPNQHIKIAKIDGELCGFACTFFNHDPKWGAMLDNLHVPSKWKKHGIGKALMKDAIQQTVDNYPDSLFYLWVLEQNIKAIKIYEKLGGVNVEEKEISMPGNVLVNSFRYVWSEQIRG